MLHILLEKFVDINILILAHWACRYRVCVHSAAGLPHKMGKMMLMIILLIDGLIDNSISYTDDTRRSTSIQKKLDQMSPSFTVVKK